MQYQTPGVFVEETSYRTQPIDGVGTSTAAFIGPTRWGPDAGTPTILTSFSDYNRIYGGYEQLQFTTPPLTPPRVNYMAQAVNAFFQQGGTLCYVQRVYHADTGDGKAPVALPDVGRAQVALPDVGGQNVVLKARHPGAYGNDLQVGVQVSLSPNVLKNVAPNPKQYTVKQYTVQGAQNYDTVLFYDRDKAALGFCWLQQLTDAQGDTFTINAVSSGSLPWGTATVVRAIAANPALTAFIVTVSITVNQLDPSGAIVGSQTWSGLSFHDLHAQALLSQFAEQTHDLAQILYAPITISYDPPAATPGATALQAALSTLVTDCTTALGVAAPPGVVVPPAADAPPVTKPTTTYATPTLVPPISMINVKLTGGADGVLPVAADYTGDDSGVEKTGLTSLEDLDDISMVAAPGSTYGCKNGTDTISQQLIGHCMKMQYRVAVLDSPNACLPDDVIHWADTLRAPDSHTAAYYPWIKISDPLTGKTITIPPSGFITGIYARNDAKRDISKAPANEPLLGATGLEIAINDAQQEKLNPKGINCIRAFPNRGTLVWGARLLTSDSEWKYINLRRYAAYLEQSILNGTQSVVFMNNGPALWAKVRSMVTDFLTSEFQKGRLMGTAPAAAFFVKCDQSTMSQNDIDNGRLICQVGVALLKPAEFIVFQVGQWTAGS